MKKTASNLVFADGNPDAKVMIIGEAPAGDEDRMGLPFVGAAGQLLDKMLAAIELDRQHLHHQYPAVAPAGKQDPVIRRSGFVMAISAAPYSTEGPQVILALGGSSAKLLLSTTTGILKLRGQVQEIDFGEAGQPMVIPVLPSLHPAYLLRAPVMKRQAFVDLSHPQIYEQRISYAKQICCYHLYLLRHFCADLVCDFTNPCRGRSLIKMQKSTADFRTAGRW